MAVLIITDIHSNYRALAAVLDRFAAGVDDIWCLGDIVSWGPCPLECIGLVRRHCSQVVHGNHDGEPGSLPDDTPAADWDYLAALPTAIAIEHESISYRLTHRPPAVSGYYTHQASDAVRGQMAAGLTEDVLLVGHTHTAMILDLPGGRRLVNAGTIGQARDGDGRAQCMILDGGEFTFHRTAYDLDAYEADCRRTGMLGDLTDTLISWTRRGLVDVHGLQVGPFSEGQAQM